MNRREFLQTSVLTTGFLLLPKTVKKLYSQSTTSCLPACLPMGLCFAQTNSSVGNPVEPSVNPTAVKLKSFEGRQPTVYELFLSLIRK